jgi:hypothetical protein
VPYHRVQSSISSAGFLLLKASRDDMFFERLLLLNLLEQKTHILSRRTVPRHAYRLALVSAAPSGEDARPPIYELALYFTPWQLGCPLAWRHAVRVIGLLLSRKYRAVQSPTMQPSCVHMSAVT